MRKSIFLTVGLILFSVCIFWCKGYIIKEGDQLQITVLGTIDDLNTQVVVSQNGTIFTQWTGEVKVAGLTFEEAQIEITKKLSRYFKNFEVIVGFPPTKPRFSIIGEVQKPGMYDLVPNLTLLEAISLAGGPTERASGEVRITKNNKDVSIIHLDEILQKGKIENNIIISPSDIIYLSDFTPNKVTIVGQVVKPGDYEIPRSKNIADLIIQAGGLLIPTPPAVAVGTHYQRPGVYQAIIRKKDKGTISLYIDGSTLSTLNPKDKEEELLDPGDVIYIREVKYSVIVLGEVASPRVYEFKIGDRITDAIALAGGFGRDPYLKEVGLIRQTEKGSLFFKIDMEKILKKGDVQKNIELKDRDIIYVAKRTRRIDWNKIVSKITDAYTIDSILKEWGTIK